jgi:hypothetical protein
MADKEGIGVFVRFSLRRIAGLVLLLSLLQINEIILLFGFGLLAIFLYSIQNKDHSFFKIIGCHYPFSILKRPQ